MKHFYLSILFLGICLLVRSQSKLELPFIGDSVIFQYSKVCKGFKKKKLMKDVIRWLENDTTFRVKTYDKKGGIIVASSQFMVATRLYPNPVDYVWTIQVEKEKISYSFKNFYLAEVELSIEAFLKKHKETTRENVKENRQYLTTGLHGKVVRLSEKFKESIGRSGHFEKDS